MYLFFLCTFASPFSKSDSVLWTPLDVNWEMALEFAAGLLSLDTFCSEVVAPFVSSWSTSAVASEATCCCRATTRLANWNGTRVYCAGRFSHKPMNASVLLTTRRKNFFRCRDRTISIKTSLELRRKVLKVLICVNFPLMFSESTRFWSLFLVSCGMEQCIQSLF